MPVQQVQESQSELELEPLELLATEQNLEVITTLAWDVVSQTNDPPKLFRFGRGIIRLERDDTTGKFYLVEITKEILRYEMARRGRWVKQISVGRGETKLVAAMPPFGVMTNMLCVEQPPLPQLMRIVEVPIFDRQGNLVSEQGFYEESGIYYRPAPGLEEIPEVPEVPTDEEITAARELVGEIMHDFPFISDEEKANAFSIAILPFVRDMILGPTPNHLIEAPSPGTGKSILAKALTRPFAGREPAQTTQTTDDEEWRKRITTLLKDNPAAILIDNITHPLDSGQLAAALTSTEWSDRALGTNQTVSYPVNCVWMCTANNPVISTELARRTIRIRLDAKIDRPWLREGFLHPDLMGWIDTERGRIIHAILTLIQAWISRGKPKGGKLLGSYEDYSRIVGGILATVGIEGFLNNLELFYETADRETELWREFVGAWATEYPDREVTVKDHLYELASNVEGLLRSTGDKAARTELGMALAKMTGRVFTIGDESYTIKLGRSFRNAKQWLLIPKSSELFG